VYSLLKTVLTDSYFKMYNAVMVMTCSVTSISTFLGDTAAYTSCD